ncbi:MAG TPA: ABC transporter permease, partial [Gemmobacter sp.]|nr:ABC transporter permease [Gemmobacter sp.]
MLPTRKRKAFLIQTVLGLLLLIGGALLIRAILQSLEGQGISSGFGFLHRSTGWDVGFSLIEYTINDPYWKVILVGVLNTLFLGSIGLVLATVLGVLIGVLRTSANPVMAFLGTCYIEAIRNVPLILQAFFWYAVFTHLPPPKVAAEAGGIIILSSRGIFVPGLNVVPGAGLLAGGLLLAGLVLA